MVDIMYFAAEILIASTVTLLLLKVLGLTKHWNIFKSYFWKAISGLYGYKSDIFVATSGVPQESNLGPLIFTYDLYSVIDCDHLLFAYYFKLFVKLVLSLTENIQDQLTRVYL